MMVDDGQPVLPYAGSSGWSGSDTSRERAEREDKAITGWRQVEALQILGTHGERGVTWFELASIMNLHHGAASGVLSNLHKVGRISRLADRRRRCKIYVLHEYVAGRATEPHRANKTTPAVQARAVVHEFIDAGGASAEDLRRLLAILEGEQ